MLILTVVAKKQTEQNEKLSSEDSSDKKMSNTKPGTLSTLYFLCTDFDSVFQIVILKEY